MSKSNKILLFFVIISIVSMSLFILYQHDDPFFIGNSELKLKVKEYSAIYIDGNAELNIYAIDGTGGERDPYIIENLVINASGLGNGIYIQNTDAYFILRNCVITNADLYCAGISLSNVTNAKITNNTVYNSYDGILLCRSSNNMLKNNTLNQNNEGICLDYSSNNVLIHNTINYNGNGIHIRYSSNNMLIHNTANHNAKNAICSFYSNNNQIYNNQFKGNGIRLIGQSLSDFIQEITADNMIDGRPIYYYKHQNSISIPPDAAQVILVNSSLMNISNCNLANGTIGISLFFSHHNTLSHNTANCNENKDDECGIYLYHSNNNTLNQNTANHNGEYGIFLEQSSNNTLINNIANYNTQYGLFLEQSSNNMLNNNTIIQNGNSGIYLIYSSNNRIYKNQFYRNGIELRGWNPSDFIEEITPDNEINGRPIYYYKYQKALTVPTDAAQVILMNCSYISILSCNVSEGTIGISLFFSHWNMILHNIANHNDLYGIYLFQSNNNTLTYNIANQNGEYGFYLEFSCNNMLIHNTATQNSIGIYILSGNNVELELYLGPTIETSLFPPGRNIVSHNIVNHNKYYGIILLHTDENTLSYNTVDDNGYGICLEKADDTLISFNVINKNEYGIYLWSSFNNKITRNTLYNNSHCICEICSWCNTIENNDCLDKFDAEVPQVPGFIWTFLISGLITILFLTRVYSRKKVKRIMG